MNTEKIILKNLVLNEEYSRKVLPFIKNEYFLLEDDRILFRVIQDFILKYNIQPTKSALMVELKQLKTNETIHKALIETVSGFEKADNDNDEWLIDTTEKFCQGKAIHNAIMKSIDIIGGKTKESEGLIPQLLSDALAISFDPNIGHDYLEDYESRFDYYHQILERVPFDLEFLNKITRGGLPKKTLNIIMAGTGAGKSLLMCHISAAALHQGKNVLYITLELSEEEVAKRIDANMMNLSFDDLLALDKESYKKRAEKLKQKTDGKLIIKEYPTASASSLQFKALLNELRLKKSFVPDIIVVDYLNICSSARIRAGTGSGSYEYIKAISEELRGMAVEYNVPVLTATQTNRTGFVSSDLGMEDVSESFALTFVADFMISLMRSEILDGLNQMEIKQLKNRYNDPTLNRKFVIGVDRSKMKCYDVEPSAQQGISDSGQEVQTQKVPQKDKFKTLVV